MKGYERGCSGRRDRGVTEAERVGLVECVLASGLELLAAESILLFMRPLSLEFGNV